MLKAWAAFQQKKRTNTQIETKRKQLKERCYTPNEMIFGLSVNATDHSADIPWRCAHKRLLWFVLSFFFFLSSVRLFFRSARRFSGFCHLFAKQIDCTILHADEITLHNIGWRTSKWKPNTKQQQHRKNERRRSFLYIQNARETPVNVRWMRALEINIIHSIPRAECEIHCGNIWKSVPHFWLYTPSHHASQHIFIGPFSGVSLRFHRLASNHFEHFGADFEFVFFLLPLIY